MRFETNSEEEGNDVDDDYFQGDAVMADIGEEESGDIHEDYIIAEEDFELDMC